MGRKLNATLVGAFVLGAVGLAVLGVVAFGSGRFFRHTDKFVLYFQHSVNGLRLGAPVKFRGVEVGAVTDVRLNLSSRAKRVEDLRIPVLIELDRERISRRGGVVALKMTKETVTELIGQGLRGQLNTESFVTGLLYVELDFHPGSVLNMVGDPEVEIQEIPTLPTAFELVQQRVSEIVNKMSELDLRHLVDSLITTVDGVSTIVNSPRLRAAVDQLDETFANLNKTLASVGSAADGLRGDVKPITVSLRSTADQANVTLESVRTLLEPGSPLAYQLGTTLGDLGAAARALKALADELERNPSVLVRGKTVTEDGR